MLCCRDLGSKSNRQIHGWQNNDVPSLSYNEPSPHAVSQSLIPHGCHRKVWLIKWVLPQYRQWAFPCPDLCRPFHFHDRKKPVQELANFRRYGETIVWLALFLLGIRCLPTFNEIHQWIVHLSYKVKCLGIRVQNSNISWFQSNWLVRQHVSEKRHPRPYYLPINW